jgi:hypothetical protein
MSKFEDYTSIKILCILKKYSVKFIINCIQIAREGIEFWDLVNTPNNETGSV